MDSFFGGFRSGLKRELRFALHDRVVLATLLAGALLATFTLLNGLKEVTNEHALIERVKGLVTQDRNITLASHGDVGSAAYYAFHFTYDPPSKLAFASRGVRDDLPWKHRVRMLALEGQIYETDTGNPELSGVGKLDYTFVIAFLLPLLLILLLYDMRAAEVRHNRWALLSATSGSGPMLLVNRAAIRACLLFICIGTPFVFLASLYGVEAVNILIVLGAVALNIVLWLLIATIVTSRIESGPTCAAVLIGAWFATVVAIPVGGKLAVEKSITVPKGGEILLLQREKVNDAWDLPKDATMKPFLERYPQWRDAVDINLSFDWTWYYAFQEVGDLSVESQSQGLRSGIAKRDQAMSLISLASPSLFTERLLTRVAGTDVSSFQRYDACVRNFHLSLREFHYPMLFGQTEYSKEQMLKLPNYEPCTS